MLNFSIVMIAKNESKTLPRLMKSLHEYLNRGGKVYLLDTGSTDGTPDLARSLGCFVEEVGTKYMVTIDELLANDINNRFIVDNELPIVQPNDKLFDFASARNHSASLSHTDMVATMDCDEAYSVLNIEAIENFIASGIEQFEYNFVFSHDQFGNEAIKFIQSKFYDRRKMKWTGLVHEVLSGTANRILVDESIIKLEHWQIPGGEHRAKYLPGLALDCYKNPDNDRNCHYLAREMLWMGRPKSAIKEFKRHLDMKHCWLQERAQSMIYMGDAFGMLGDEDMQVKCYHESFQMDGSRRASLISLMDLYHKKLDLQKALCYAAAALEIPWNGFYANDRYHYTDFPHSVLFKIKLFFGDKEGSKYHYDKALSYSPNNPEYLSYYNNYYGATNETTV
jgi:glycosyltransferase involved in cell wall biosynthesis